MKRMSRKWWRKEREIRKTRKKKRPQKNQRVKQGRKRKKEAKKKKEKQELRNAIRKANCNVTIKIAHNWFFFNEGRH